MPPLEVVEPPLPFEVEPPLPFEVEPPLPLEVEPPLPLLPEPFELQAAKKNTSPMPARDCFFIA